MSVWIRRRNPGRANLVNAPEDWEWSSYAATVGLRPPPSFVNVSATLSLFGPGDEAVLQAQFREFVCGEIDRTIDDRFARLTRSSETTSSRLVSCPGPPRVPAPRTLRMNQLDK